MPPLKIYTPRLKTGVESQIKRKNQIIKKQKIQTRDRTWSKIEKKYLEVEEIFNKSTALQYIARTQKKARTIAEFKNAFLKAKVGIERKYNLKISLVESGMVQKITKSIGNKATYLEKERQILIEKIYLSGNPTEINYKEILLELQHEYGAFLLSKKYGSKNNIPKIGNRWATHILDGLAKKIK